MRVPWKLLVALAVLAGAPAALAVEGTEPEVASAPLRPSGSSLAAGDSVGDIAFPRTRESRAIPEGQPVPVRPPSAGLYDSVEHWLGQWGPAQPVPLIGR